MTPTSTVTPLAQRIPVVIHAADPISRAGVTAALRFRREVVVSEERAALADTDEATVDLVVCDDVEEGVLQTIRRLARAERRVVLVATRIDDAGLLTAVEAGVCGVLRRSEASPEHLARVVAAASAGDGTLPPDLLGRLLGQVGALQRQVLSPRGLNLNGLTEREIAVLRLVAEGYDTTEIASALRYSERTIKNVIHDITTRLQLRNRSHAVAYALRAGII